MYDIKTGAHAGLPTRLRENYSSSFFKQFNRKVCSYYSIKSSHKRKTKKKSEYDPSEATIKT